MFEKFRKLLLEELGIHFEPHRRYFIDKRIARRMRATDCESEEEYYRYLVGPGGRQELQALTNEVTVNETYFYRESYHLDALVQHMLPELAERRLRPGDPPLRIWSIPCSTGEEPYSVAMHLLEEWPSVDKHSVEIIASDVDTRAMEAAKEGVYGRRALRALPERFRERYFHPFGEDQMQISVALRRSVDFCYANLNSDDWLDELGRFDIIFCRNLLIYFNDKTRRQAALRLFRALRPGGFLCLGHSESMQRIAPEFIGRHWPEAVVYQRPVSERMTDDTGQIA